MPREGQTTDLMLLEWVGDWADHAIWRQLIGRYDPLIRKYCQAYRFDADASEETAHGDIDFFSVVGCGHYRKGYVPVVYPPP